MNAEQALANCEVVVRKSDPDRYFSVLFAPAEKRPLLFAVYAFNHELARVAEIVRERMMGEIRLQWWREALEGARDGKPRPHDVARALAELFTRVEVPPHFFEAMIEARAFDFSADAFANSIERDAYLDATSGNLMRLAARVLGAGNAHDELAHEAGVAYGLVGLIRSQAFHRARGKQFIADTADAVAEAQQRLSNARALPAPGRTLPAFLPAALVPLYLRDPAKDLPLYRKQLTLLGASLRGRI